MHAKIKENLALYIHAKNISVAFVDLLGEKILFKKKVKNIT